MSMPGRNPQALDPLMSSDRGLTPATRLWSPRLWPSWLLLGWMKLVYRLPYPWPITIGMWFGRIGGALSPRARGVVARNLELCFPELSDSERAALLREHFKAVGAAFAEMAIGWFSPIERLLKLVQVEGYEHLEIARRTGKGIILLSAHFTPLETGVSILEELSPGIRTVYRPQPNVVIDAMIRRGRRRFAKEQIPKDNIRAMVRSLRDGETVIYIADHASKGSSSALIPFFGEPAITSTTTSKLATLTGATVLSYFFRRLPGKSGYLVTIGAPLENFPTDDLTEDSRRLTRQLEDYIRLAPEQYMWTYRRFKSRPAPYPDVYKSPR